MPAGPDRRRPLAGSARVLAASLLVLVALQPEVLRPVDGLGRQASGAFGQDLFGVLRWIEVAFDEHHVRLYGALLVACLLVLRAPRLAGFAVLTTCAAPVVSSSLKAVFDRERPQWQLAGHALGSASFPSTHTVINTALAGTVVVVAATLARERGRQVAWLRISCVAGLGLVTLVGADRILLGRHYPTDVLAGVVVGLAVVAAGALVTGVAASQANSRESGRPGDEFAREAVSQAGRGEYMMTATPTRQTSAPITS